MPGRKRAAGLCAGLCVVLLAAACAPPEASYAPRYCYRTLGVVDCHAAPLPDAAPRRVGHFDAPLED